MTQTHATTIIGLRRDGKAALGGDGQVTLGTTIMKHHSNKIRRVYNDSVLVGFAGAAADATPTHGEGAPRRVVPVNSAMTAAIPELVITALVVILMPGEDGVLVVQPADREHRPDIINVEVRKPKPVITARVVTPTLGAVGVYAVQPAAPAPKPEPTAAELFKPNHVL